MQDPDGDVLAAHGGEANVVAQRRSDARGDAAPGGEDGQPIRVYAAFNPFIIPPESDHRTTF